MQRKLVRMGKNCLMAAIPKKWLDKQNLGKGDHIEFQEADKYLLLSPKELPKSKSISIDLKDNDSPKIVRTLLALYEAGYNSINILFKRPKVINHINFALNILEEWRLKDITDKSCKIESSDFEEKDFKTYFSSTFSKVIELSKEALEIMKNTERSKEMLGDLKHKYKLIMIGTMNLKRMTSIQSLPIEFKYYYYIVSELEEIANRYEAIIRLVTKGFKPTKETIRTSIKLSKNLAQAKENVSSFELEKTSNIDLIGVSLDNENILTTYNLMAISDSIKKITKYTLSINA